MALAVGHRLAFISDRDGPFRLYTMKPDGSDIRRLSDQPVDQMPFSVSRDGTQIAAAASVDGGDTQSLRLYRIDVAGGATVPIGEAPPSDTVVLFPAPLWRADDAAISVLNYTICYEFPSGGGEVREQDSESCAEAGILANGPDDRWALIAGDGLLVGKGTDYAGAKKIDTVTPAGAIDNEMAGLAFLAMQRFGMWRPLWSPDGTQIAYLDNDAAGQAGLAVIPSEGGASRLVLPVNTNSMVIPTAWSDDGATIYFSGIENQSTIDAVDVKTGASHRIAGGDGHAYLYPRWVVEAPAPARASVPFERAAQASELKTELAKASGRLVYEGGDSRRGFFSANPDGTDERRLSDDSPYPSFTSADGKWLSYTGRGTGSTPGTMIVINTVTGERRELGTGVSPTVSPSGRLLVYWERPSQADSGWVLVRLDLDSSNLRELVRGDGVDFGTPWSAGPSWSPDGSKIAFFKRSPADRPDATEYDLTVIHADGGSESSIATITSDPDAPPVWSPDGSQIAFIDDTLRVVPSKGGTARDYGVSADSATWSPDGKQIAVLGGGIILVDVASGEPTRLTSDIGGAGGGPPDWSPDGRWLAYAGSDGTLRVMDVATRGVVRLEIEGDQVHWALP